MNTRIIIAALVAALSGSVFGAGLALGGMTDPVRVRGFLDLFGDWDPTLAFVMGGAMIPMLIAWRLAGDRRPAFGGSFPDLRTDLDRRLIAGSVLFGAGWGLAGLCPGPSIASLSYGGVGGLIFLAAMLVGMGAAPAIGNRLDRWAQPA